MKEVILNSRKPAVDIDNVSISKIYAGLDRNDKIVVMTPTEYEGNAFIGVILEDITIRNSYGSELGYSLQRQIETFCKGQTTTVYEFDNLKEFLQWALTKTN